MEFRDAFVSTQLLDERVEVSGEDRLDVYLCELAGYLPIGFQFPGFAIDDATEGALSFSALLLWVLHLHLLGRHLVGGAVGRRFDSSLLLHGLVCAVD